VLSIYESDLVSFLPHPTPLLTGEGTRAIILNQTNASNINYPKISWNYNGVYVKAGTYYLPTPSIINGNIWWNIDLEVDTTALESQVITGWDNIPLVSTWWLDWMTVEVFSWELDTTKWRDEWGNKELLAQALIDAYSWTTLASAWVYKEIVETSSEDLVSLVDSFVLNSDNFVNIASWWNTTSNTISWKDLDSNCLIDDIVIWDQVWAWCNSTLWNWIEYISEVRCWNYNKDRSWEMDNLWALAACWVWNLWDSNDNALDYFNNLLSN